MGAGDFPAGSGPAGSDPVVSTGPALTNSFPVPKFDAGLKDFPLDEDGHYISVHPVDQAVNLALGVQDGKVASVSGLGNALKAIVYAGGPRLQNEVTTAVRNALRKLLNAGDIELGPITVEPVAFGGFLVAVEWRNLRVLNAQNRTSRLSTT
jgi:hypothetical protein